MEHPGDRSVGVAGVSPRPASRTTRRSTASTAGRWPTRRWGTSCSSRVSARCCHRRPVSPRSAVPGSASSSTSWSSPGCRRRRGRTTPTSGRCRKAPRWSLSLDGSFNQDATALVVAEIGETPHLDVVGLWEPPGPPAGVAGAGAGSGAGDPETPAVGGTCARVVADPFRWTRSLQLLEDEGLPMIEFPQSASRMTPATTGAVRGRGERGGDPLRRPAAGPARRQRHGADRPARHPDLQEERGPGPTDRPRGVRDHGALRVRSTWPASPAPPLVAWL